MITLHLPLSAGRMLMLLDLKDFKAPNSALETLHFGSLVFFRVSTTSLCKVSAFTESLSSLHANSVDTG